MGSLSGPSCFRTIKIGAQLSGSFLKIAFFKKGTKIGFFNFLCFKFKNVKLFFRFAKALKIGFSAII